MARARRQALIIGFISAWVALSLPGSMAAQPSVPPTPVVEGPCAETIDTFDDGQIDLRIAYRYGSNGRLEAAEHDAGADGEIDRTDTFVYGAGEDAASAGQLTEIRTDLGADGTVDERFVFEYSSGPSGTPLLAREAIYVGAATDGEPAVVYQHEYDELGREVREVRRSADGAVESIVFEYDEGGGLSEEHVDIDGDGDSDRSVVYERDDDLPPGHGLRVVAEDRDGNGVADWVYRYVYGPNDRLVTEEWLSDALDMLTARTTFRYDTAGRLVEEAFDDLDDGTVDVRTTYDWSCYVADP